MRKLLLIVTPLLLAAPALAESLLINGAGATFPFPLYSKWFHEYHRLKPALQFNYQSIGSGGGIKQITEKTVDFGASDAPMSNEEMARAPGILHIPTVIGAVAVAYHLPGVARLRITADVLADLFLGKITRWSDSRIALINPGVKLPDTAVMIVHRSDGSGTTAVFTDYLAKVSSAWKTKVGAGKSVRWPAGLGAKGNEGVTGQVRSTEGAVGYVELAYATQNRLSVMSIANRSGAFVAPSVEGATAAAVGQTIPADYRVSLADSADKQAYPIASFTYLLVYRQQSNPAKGKALAGFLWWATHEGQKLAPALEYAPLPSSLVTRIETTLRSIEAGGRSALGR